MESSADFARPDRICAEAVDAARAALVDAVEPELFGEHLGVRAEGVRVATHDFACTQPGYDGWRWSVTLTRASRHRTVTVNEVVLLPGSAAIVAPRWRPYNDRIEPGDMSPGDLLPVEDDDIRLVPGWSAGDPAVDNLIDPTSVRPIAEEVGLGRIRVLSLEGRELATQRWYEGDQGPDNELTRLASHTCRSCGFLVQLAGPLSTMFGVCANGFANDDGRVVAYDHGCGAHSKARLARSAQPQTPPDPFHDTITVDDVEPY